MKINLQKKLDTLTAQSLENAPADIIKLFKDAATDLIASNIQDKALKVGDTIENFSLYNILGEKIHLYDELQKGPMILCFYRGSWCPYCNLELSAYQELLPEIQANGGGLIAISPELPSSAVSVVDKYMLKYTVATDLGNKLARKLGLTFELDSRIKPIYEKLGVDLVKFNGDESYELPVPATYIIDENGKVVLANVDADYQRRLEPEVALKKIIELNDAI